MKLFYKGKDGGPESRVWGYWLIEQKKLISIALMHFQDGTRGVYHSHAFNSLSWVLWGELTEVRIDGTQKIYKPSIIPIWTSRSNVHRVSSKNNSWVLTFRGRWHDMWMEFDPWTKRVTHLTTGRKVFMVTDEQGVEVDD